MNGIATKLSALALLAWLAQAVSGCGCDGGGSLVIGGCGPAAPTVGANEDAGAEFDRSTQSVQIVLAEEADFELEALLTAATSVTSLTELSVTLHRIVAKAGSDCDAATPQTFSTSGTTVVALGARSGDTVATLEIPADLQLCEVSWTWAGGIDGLSFVASGQLTDGTGFAIESHLTGEIASVLTPPAVVGPETRVALGLRAADWLAALHVAAVAEVENGSASIDADTNADVLSAIETRMNLSTLEVIP